MKTITAIIFILMFSLGYCQDASSGEVKKGIPFRQITPEDKFESDLKRNSFTIYTLGGLKPYNHEIVQSFEKKFSVNYHDFGCLAESNMDFYEKYNLLVYEHLTKKWGAEWEKDIKDNAMGFYKWKEAK
jgi:hypothetical protein